MDWLGPSEADAFLVVPFNPAELSPPLAEPRRWGLSLLGEPAPEVK